jgi:hypothetical protein
VEVVSQNATLPVAFSANDGADKRPDSAVQDADGLAALDEIRERLANDLRTEIAGMSLDNFLVRPKALCREICGSKSVVAAQC